jgi:hypothetical protein
MIAGGAFGGLAANLHMGLVNGGRGFTGAAEYRPETVTDMVPATLGIDRFPAQRSTWPAARPLRLASMRRSMSICLIFC